MLLQCGKTQAVEVLMRNRILKQMRILLLCNRCPLCSFFSQCLLHGTARSLCIAKMQYRKTDYHVLRQMLTYPTHFPERWKELAQTPGQSHIDACSFVDTQKGHDLVI